VRYWLIMPAAGTGSRFGESLPKQYVSVCGRTIIEWSLSPFAHDARCAGIVVALATDDPHWPRVAQKLGRSIISVQGGAERSHSVRNALQAIASQAQPQDWVLVHDAARPCLSLQDLDLLLEKLETHPVGGLLAARASDTLKRAGADATVEQTVDRTGLWRALTPQMFRYGDLSTALDRAIAEGRLPTDEAQALEWSGRQPQLVEGSPDNIKITHARDLVLAEALLRRRTMRVGSGIDVHAFGPGDFVMLGGVRVPYTKGVIAHSDGDVILHALCDALLGAAGLGDIGQHFRDDDPQWRGAESKQFVIRVMDMLKTRGLRVLNADVTVLAEGPRLARYRADIRRTLAELLEVREDVVNIKATTTEKLGFIGRSEGLAAQAIVALSDG
jgi:2-C-methyl-D-erythritol 4-phosphate cytidylyltransferase / 2-C-methyl-D-erythritol 2,4-cyclodiphosphate synthase